MANGISAILSMGWNAWFTIAVVSAITLIMAREKLGPDLAMFGGLCVLVVAGVLDPNAALTGFSQPEVATIGVLFVCAAAIQETGALHMMSNSILGRSQSPVVAMLRLSMPTAALSAFMNNTPIVAMFIPVVKNYAKRLGHNPSRFLIPLSYAAMFGGTCTLIGTSANLVVSGLMNQSGLPPMGMLEISKIGIPSTVIGLIYLMTIGRHLLPDRQAPMDAAHEEAREYLAEVAVLPDSPLSGKTIEEAGLRNLPGLFLVEIRRYSGEVTRPVAPEDRLQPKDHLVFTGIASTVQDLLSDFPGLTAVDELHLSDRNLFEVVISHRSRLIGRTVKAVNFRRRYDAAILAIHRAGERIEGKIGAIILQPGDTLMLSASPGFQRAWRNSPAFYLVSSISTEAPPRYKKAPLAVITVLALVLIPSTTNVPMLVSAMGALVVLIATQSISARSARLAVNWSVLILIASAFGIANALEQSGAAKVLGELLLALTEDYGPRATLTGVYILGVVFASFISNAAAAALVFPVAMTAATASGLDPRPFAMALALAASAGFSTPIGCQPNLLVYGPGGYQYLDFTKVGLPLNGILMAFAIFWIPIIWPFGPVLLP